MECFLSHKAPRLRWRRESALEVETAALRSAAGVEYALKRAIPQQRAPDARYPALIVLDAAHHFSGFAAIAERLAERADKTGVAPIALIGLDSVDPLSRRFQDFTPWAPERDIDGADRDFGHAAAFAEFVSGECLDALTAEIGLDISRIGLVGHSLSGYFALYAASQTARFSTIGAFSPSLWWNEPRLREALERSRLENTSFMLSVGGRERNTERRMIERATDMAGWLAKRSRSTKFLLAQEEDHASAPFVSFPAFLRFFHSVAPR